MRNLVVRFGCRGAARGLVAAVLVATIGVVGGVAGPAGATRHEDGCFVMRSYQVFLDRDATAGEIELWQDWLAGGIPRHRLPGGLAESDEWLSTVVTALYQQALDRNPDAAGRDYWVDQLRRGARVNRVGSLIYGSDEFYDRAGGTDELFVTDLYQRILGRGPAGADRDYWVDQVAARGRGRVAGLFFASIESRTRRVQGLYADLLGRAAEPAGLAYWTAQLAKVNDVRLAVELASGNEFFSRAQAGCVLPPLGQIVFQGRGWGHGRGMGQWGALGYAVDHGWSGTQILNHYYGGTTTQALSSEALQRVYLVSTRGQELIVTQGAARLRVNGYDAEVAAVRIARAGSGRFQVWTGPGCGGPWTPRPDVHASFAAVWSTVAQGETRANMLQRCTATGAHYYRGSLRAVDVDGTIVTVNEVPTESMLRSIVPREMPASWANVGGGRGAAALRAQAVAARSYAMAGDTRWGSWATTCDTTTCQVYGGYGVRVGGTPTSGGTFTSNEHPLSDAAIAGTPHQVRRHGNGTIARTEFSSSTGGYTAGGTFPAVVDLGDAYATNPNHQWTETRTRQQIEAAYDARQGTDMGSFLGFANAERNGLGAFGGRVLTITARFANGNVTLTGEQVRSLLGLKSNWFTA